MAREGRRGGTYQEAGVDFRAEEAAMGPIARAVRSTFGHHPSSKVLLDIGFFANVLDVGPGPCIAVSTDSAGTKVLVAEMMGRHDTIGVDCVAMNVNDVLCVGADPVCFLDYIAVTEADPSLLAALLEGVREGAARAECSVPGGEVAQVRDILRGAGAGPHYDLVGTAVGVVDRERILTGKGVRSGDVVVGIASTGLHSNGYTLARSVLLDRMGLDPHDRVGDLGRTLGEEMLEPTAIYVREVKRILSEGLGVRGLANITGGGLLNVLRLDCPGTGFLLDDLPEPQPIFRLIQEGGGVSSQEMYRVFNMGVGFCLVVAEEDAARAVEICKEEGKEARVLGRAVDDPDRRLLLPGPGLAGRGEEFRPAG